MCGGKREESQAEEQDGKRGSKRRESAKAEFGGRDERGERERKKERQDKSSEDKIGTWSGTFPTEVGVAPEQMGNSLLSFLVPHGRQVVEGAMGEAFTCVIVDD